MADKYWYVANDGNANWAVGNNWYTTALHTPGTSGSVPTSTDNAILNTDSGTGSLNIAAAAVCNSLDATYFSGSLTGGSTLAITNTTTDRTSNVSPLFAFGAAMTQSYVGTTTFGGSAIGTGGWIFCNGKSFSGSVTFNNAAATFLPQDDFRTLPTNTLTLSAGTISSNFDIYCGTFSQTTTSIKSIFCFNLYLTGITPTGTISGTNFTQGITAVYITDTSPSTKTVTFNTQFSIPELYFSGSGPMALAPGTTFKPNVYVDNVGTAASSFNINTAGAISSLIFQPNTAVTWSNSGVEVSLAGNLTLTSSMAVTTTPILTFLNGTSNITLAGLPLTPGNLLKVEGSIVHLKEDFNNNVPISIISNGILYAKGLKTAYGITITDSELRVLGAGYATGSGAITAAAVDGQRYDIVTPTTYAFIASKDPVPTENYTLYTLYFLTGSTPSATAASLVTKINSSSFGELIASSSGARLSLSSSIAGTTFNGATFSTGSILGQAPTTTLFTLGGGSGTARATGSGTLLAAAVDGQRYDIVSRVGTGTPTIYSYVASGLPLPTDIPNTSAYYFSTGSTPQQTVQNLVSKISNINSVVQASYVGSTLILSSSEEDISYNGAAFKTGSIYGKIPDYTLFTLTGSTYTTPFSVESINIGNSIMTVNATEATCSGAFTNSNAVNFSRIYGNNLYIGGTVTLSGASVTDVYSKNLYIDGAVNISNASNLFFYNPNNTVIPGLTTVTTNGSGIAIVSASVVFSNLTATNATLGSTDSPLVCTKTLTYTNGDINFPNNNIYIGNLSAAGGLARQLVTPNLYFTGTGSLATVGANVDTTFVSNIYITDSSISAKTLTLTSTFPTTPNTSIYIEGSGSGNTNLASATTNQGDVYVNSTGLGTPVSLSGTIKNLTFSASSTAIFSNNLASAALTIIGTASFSDLMSISANPPITITSAATHSFFNKTFNTGTLTINTASPITISGSLLSNAAITLTSSSIAIQNNFSASGLLTINGGSRLTPSGSTFFAGSTTITSGSINLGRTTSNTISQSLTLTTGNISASRELSIGNLVTTGATVKSLNAPNLLFTGIGTLYTSGTNFTISPTLSSISITGSATSGRALTFDAVLTSSLVYIGGDGSGPITASFLSASRPNVYVTNTGAAPISFLVSTIQSLSFISSSTANWNNTGSQTLTISGSLTLTGSMTASRTPNLIFSGNSNITMAGKNLSGSLISQSPFTQSFLDNFSSSGSVTINGFLSASNVTITNIESLNVLGNCNISSSAISTTTITGTGSVWNIPSTSTVNIPNNTIRIVNTTNNAVTFSGGTNEIYGDLTFARGASTAGNLISGSNAFTNLRDTGTAAHTMSLATGTTQTVGHFDVKGTPGNRVYLTGGSLSKSPAGLVISDYLDVVNSTAISGSGPWTWFAGPNSTLVNAAGWSTTGSHATASIVRRLGSQGAG